MKKMSKRLLGLILAVLMLSTATVAFAANMTSRLKENLESCAFYEATTIDDLTIMYGLKKSDFEKQYKNQYVVLTGRVGSDSLSSDHKQVKVYNDRMDSSITVDSSMQNALAKAGTLRTGDTVTVWGKVTMNLFSSGFEVRADYLDVNDGDSFDKGAIISLAGGRESYEGVQISDGRLQLTVPAAWKGEHVMNVSKANKTNVYRFSLNALEPWDTEYPELFYAFYFTNETYLDNPPSTLSDGVLEKIEAEIVKNILGDLAKGKSVSVRDVKTIGSRKVDYCLTSSASVDGTNYRLEFFFVPDDKGITCMLYLYYPSEGSVHHSMEAAYVIDSLLE